MSVSFECESAVRPAYRDGQTLRAADLHDEAENRIAGANTHQLHAHLSGIVAGLRFTTDAGRIALQPGAAVDSNGRTILVPSADDTFEVDESDPFDVWIAFRQTPEDDVDSERIVDQYDVFTTRYGETPLSGTVYLGSVVDGKVDESRRQYVGAVGSRIESASRRTLMLLGPDSSGDLRVFAVGTRDAETEEYRDVLAADSAGTISMSAPIAVASDRKKAVAVVVGDRPPEFRADEILDPAAVARRWIALAIPNEPSPVPPDFHRLSDDELRVILARGLNRILVNQQSDALIDALCLAGTDFREAAFELLQARTRDARGVDEPALRRLLLEDAFPSLVARFSERDPGGVLGISFSGTSAPATLARPGSVALNRIENETGTSRELRIEFPDPGPEQHPERYKACIGTVENFEHREESEFAGLLIVDASQSVTLEGNLEVYDPSGSEGLILVVAPPADPNDPASLAAQLSQVGPNDLHLHLGDNKFAFDASNAIRFPTSSRIVNKAKARLAGVRLDATVFPTNDTNPEPLHFAVLDGIALDPDRSAELDTLAIPLASPDGPNFSDKATFPKLTLLLKAIGAGPGNILAECSRRFDLPTRI